MITAYLLLVHAAGLALTVFSILRSGQRPQVLLYAFILDYILRLITIEMMGRAIGGRGFSGLRATVPYLTRLPAAGQQSYPVRQGEAHDAPPAAFGSYLLLMTVFTGFAFVLVHVNADKELALDARTFAADLRWGILIALIRWSESLAARSIVLDPAATRAINFGYNTREVTVLAFAVLTSGLIVAIRQGMDLPASGWAVLGPLLAFRALYDFSFAMELRKTA
jgi:hypothetical protein